jgi:inosine-uridine nucleoside N-ribohydrolase
VAGAETSLTTDQQFTSTWGDERYWPDPVVPRPSSPEQGLDLLVDSARRGATILAIGAFTNLALLELERPDTLRDVDIVAMAGWLTPPDDGMPNWGPELDFNMQCDTEAADIVISATRITFVPLPVAMHAQLRRRDLARLRASGPIGALLARQSAAYASDNGMDARGREHPGLADDLVNFHWDPVTAAVAAGWSGAAIEDVTLETQLHDSTLALHPTLDGRSHRVITGIDADVFTDVWLASVETADRRAATRRGSVAR